MLRVFIGLLIFLFSIASQAQSLCQGVHILDSFEQRKSQGDRLLKEKLVGNSENGPSEFMFYWHSAYPFQLKKISDRVYRTAFSEKRMVIYKNHEDVNSKSGLQAVNTFMGRKDMSNQALLESYLDIYKKNSTPQTIEAIRALENVMQAAANERQSFGLVATGLASMGGEVLGTFRVYNGVPSHTPTPAYLPLEYSLAKNQVQTKTAEKLEKLRKDNPNAFIFELGRLSIHGTAETTERTKGLLDLFLLRKYLDVLPDDALFYAHCASKVLARANQQHYGFKVVEEVDVPGKGTQYILEATAKQIRETFEKRYGLSSAGIQILHP